MQQLVTTLKQGLGKLVKLAAFFGIAVVVSSGITDSMNRPDLLWEVAGLITLAIYFLTNIHRNSEERQRLRKKGICPECKGLGRLGSDGYDSNSDCCYGTGVFIRPYLDVHPSHLGRPYRENSELEKESA